MTEHAGFFNGIRTKVLIGFAVILIAVAIAAIINFISLNRLASSVETLATRDKKGESMRQLLVHLDNEESSVRAFTLTMDSQYLRFAHNFRDSIYYRLGELRHLTLEDSNQLALTDSIVQLVTNREVLMDHFILKRNASSQVSGASEKSASTTSRQIPVVDPQQNAAPDSSISVTEEKSSDGFFSFKWLKGKNKKDQSRDQKTETAPRSTEGRTQPTASVDIQAIAEKEESEMKERMQTWGAEEVELLRQNQEVMNKIRISLSSLEAIRSEAREKQAEGARRSSDESVRIMTGIAILGIAALVILIMLILRDIRRSNQLRARLVEEHDRAEKLAKVKEEFLANMSHEIRTPLNAIIGFADLLSANDNSVKEKKEFVQAIQRSSSHLLSLVNQILDFSKLEAGRWQKEDVTFSLKELLAEIYQTFQLTASEKGIRLSYTMENNVPPMLSGDELSLRQILINIVGNAIKFTGKGGVTIHSSVEGENDTVAKVRIEISDTGIGISPEDLNKIFSPFTQSNNEITRKYGGTGLGLTISRKLVEILGGEIHITSEQGKGSVFTLTVPFKKASVELKEELPPVPVEHGSLRNKKVLIVDDEEMNILLCKTILESRGAITDSATMGTEALQKLRHQNYDVVLLDIHMPEMSGFEVIRRIRESEDETRRNIPVIAVTANVYHDTQKDYEEAGFTDYLIKPFKEHEFFEKLCKHFASEEIPPAHLSVNADEKNAASNSFSLIHLEKTSGANYDFIISMLESFIKNNQLHIDQISQALEANDLEKIRMLAHKMIPSFRYLEIKNTEHKLKELEKLATEPGKPEQVRMVANEIIEETRNLIPPLESELRKLREKADLIPS